MEVHWCGTTLVGVGRQQVEVELTRLRMWVHETLVDYAAGGWVSHLLGPWVVDEEPLRDFLVHEDYRNLWLS